MQNALLTMSEEFKPDSELVARNESDITDSAVKGSDPSVKKRSVKLTEKALLGKIGNLQQERKVKLKRAWNLKDTIVGLMNEKGFVQELKGTFAKFIARCDEAKEIHAMLMGFLPKEEAEKHDMWFKVKMLSATEFISDVNKWLIYNESCQHAESVGMDVDPQDSISCVQSKASSKGYGRKSAVSNSSRSSTSSIRLQAEAEKAALVARAAALKEKHALEEQAEQLRRKKEQLEINTEIATSSAKLAVLNTTCHGSTRSDGMSSYFEKGTALNPHAEQYIPQQKDSSQQKYAEPANTHATVEKTMEKENAAKQAGFEWKRSDQTKQRQGELNPSGHLVPHTQGNPQLSGDFYNLLHRQNEITATLVQMQNSQLLSHREVPVFDGSPLEYRSFIRAFEQCVEVKTNNKGDCLYYLEQFTRGHPKDLVCSCQHMLPERGYAEAKDLLHKHFGQEVKIAAAYVSKIIGWPSIKAEDGKALQAYALFLRECCNAMEDLQYLDELNMPANMKTVIQNLPYKLREKWRTLACDISEKQRRRPGFKGVIE